MDREVAALQIGRLILVCANVELAVHMIARDLGEPDVDRLGMSRQLQAIRRRTSSREDSDEFEVWTRKVDTLLRHRGALAHGLFMTAETDSGDKRLMLWNRRTNEHLSLDPTHLDSLLAEADALWDEGAELGPLIIAEQIAEAKRANPALFLESEPF